MSTTVSIGWNFDRSLALLSKRTYKSHAVVLLGSSWNTQRSLALLTTETNNPRCPFEHSWADEPRQLE